MKNTLLLFVTILLLSPFTWGQQVDNLPNIHKKEVSKYDLGNEAHEQWLKNYTEQKDVMAFQREQERIRYERAMEEHDRILEEMITQERKSYEQRREERLKNKKTGTGPVLESDSLALVAFYNATDGPNWTDNTNWLTGEVNSWFGIEVYDNRVVEIYMGYNGNNLTGMIPAEIGNFDGLEFLGLTNNKLSGSLPKEIGNLTNLTQLHIIENQLGGELPEELFKLNKLYSLYLAANKFTGSIPNTIGGLSNLKVLSLVFNEFTGTIPKELGDLISLEELDLRVNYFSDSIPTELGSLENLTFLGLSDNKLIGSIPIKICNLTNLERLFLGENHLTGSIPKEIINLTSMEYFYVGNNKIEGVIPEELFNMENLQQISLYKNEISGTIPSSIGNSINLEYLDIASNEISGILPSEIGRLSKLQNIYLSDNKLEGSIPITIGGLVNLQRLYLSNNNIEGNIPGEIGGLVNLTDIELSGNNISGSIPGEIGELVNLGFLRMDNNQLVGEIPSEIGNLENLFLIDISNNNIEKIPDEINNLLNLYYLNCSNNLLNTLPDMSSLTNLEYIDISNNSLDFEDFVNCKINWDSLPSKCFTPQKLLDINYVSNDTSVILSVNVNGTGNKFQWCKYNSSPNEDTMSELTINLRDTGVYYCMIKHEGFGSWALFTKVFGVGIEVKGGIDKPSYDALVSFYEKTGGDNWTINDNWLSDKIVSEWYGINVYFAQVLGIDFKKGNNLFGTIPEEIGDLHELYYLDLGYNNFSGSIPTSIFNLEDLWYLDLSNNKLIDSIPKNIGNMWSMQELKLSNNQLEGTIPEGITELQWLRVLDVENNNLSGKIPGLRELSWLEKISFGSNNFEGSLPESFKDLISLKYLSIRETGISSLNDLSSLTLLDTLLVNNAKLTFEDFYASGINFDSINYVEYWPQKNVEIPNSYVYGNEGDYLNLNMTELSNNVIYHSNNQHQWYKDNLSVSDFSSVPVFNVEHFLASDTGWYQCKIINSDFPELTLLSDTIYVGINLPPTDLIISSDTILENQPEGSIVGVSTVDDPNHFDTYEFHLISGDGTNDIDNSSFYFDADTLKSSVIFDYETKSEYYIYVQVEDAAGLTFEKAFSISVTDVDEVGIRDITSQNISVYPNPSSGKFTLELSVDNYQFKVYDVYGKLVGESVGEESVMDIDLSGKPAGIYYLVVNYSDKVINKKLIVR